MHRSPARSRGRMRRALLAAASDVASYVANDGETNQVSVRVVGSRLVMSDAAPAGEMLKAEVEATDRGGARQVERDAGKVRVS